MTKLLLPPSLGAHIRAIRALLEDAGWRVHVGGVDDPNPPLPYVLLAGVTGTGRAVAVCGRPTEVEETVRVTVVASTGLACLEAVEAVRGVLAGARPVVPGRRCEPLRHVGGMDVAPDRDVVIPATGTHPYYAIDEWRLNSTPTQED